MRRFDFERGDLIELRKNNNIPVGVRYTFSEPQSNFFVRNGEHIVFDEPHNQHYFWGINPTTGERGLTKTRLFKKVRKK